MAKHTTNGDNPMSDHGRNGVMSRARRVVAIGAWSDASGVRLEFFEPPSTKGISSPIVELFSTNDKVIDAAIGVATIWAMRTASGSDYEVAMDKESERSIPYAFFRWAKSRRAE